MPRREKAESVGVRLGVGVMHEIFQYSNSSYSNLNTISKNALYILSNYLIINKLYIKEKRMTPLEN